MQKIKVDIRKMHLIQAPKSYEVWAFHWFEQSMVQVIQAKDAYCTLPSANPKATITTPLGSPTSLTTKFLGGWWMQAGPGYHGCLLG